MRTKLPIVYIADSRIPTERAHGLQIMKMCEAFSKIGHQVELILPFRFQTPKMKTVKNVSDYYNIQWNFSVTTIPMFDLLQVTYNFKKLSIYAFLFQSLIFEAIASLYAYSKYQKQVPPALFFTRDWKIAWLLVRFGLPTILEMHVFPKSNFAVNQIVKITKSKNFALLVVITNALKKLFIDAGVPDDRIITLHDGVDLEMFDMSISKMEARAKLGIPTALKCVVYTGHLYKWKGVYTLVEASAFLDGIEIIIVGGTTEDIPVLKEFVTKNGYNNVKIVGYVEHNLIPYYLKAADALVLPNSGLSEISSSYTSPLKLFEYMASKRPIVASAVPSIMEVLHHEHNAILVEPDNPRVLGDGIKRVMDDPDLASRISEQAYQDVQRFTWEERALAIIKTAMSKKAS